MAFPATDLPDPSTWFSNALVTSALMKANLTDPINTLPRGLLGTSTNSGSVTLTTVGADAAGLATVTATLPSQRRVLILAKARYVLGGATSGRMQMFAAYNSGASAVIGSVVKPGSLFSVHGTVSGSSGTQSLLAVATPLLTAGQYTFYADPQRVGGQSSDTATDFETWVLDIGSS